MTELPTHIPALVREVLQFLIQPGYEVIWDATVGLGGHAEAILQTFPGTLIGFDWDKEALEIARERLKPYGERVHLVPYNFAHLYDAFEEYNLPRPGSVLFDLGLSSLHIERAERGFSFQKHGPLDMRMSQELEKTAEEILNQATFEELVRILRKYGEEKQAKKIAQEILTVRKVRPLKSTTELADIVSRVVKGGKIHPATRTFQALRIAVNQELENLQAGLDQAVQLLLPKGRIGVISFHSLEDRVVKKKFRDWEQKRLGKVITPKPITPSQKEKKRNPRSRSAKLRVFEKGENHG